MRRQACFCRDNSSLITLPCIAPPSTENPVWVCFCCTYHHHRDICSSSYLCARKHLAALWVKGHSGEREIARSNVCSALGVVDTGVMTLLRADHGPKVPPQTRVQTESHPFSSAEWLAQLDRVNRRLWGGRSTVASIMTRTLCLIVIITQICRKVGFLFNSSIVACDRVYLSLGRLRGDAMFSGNDFANVINSDGGFIRSAKICFYALVVYIVVLAVAEQHIGHHWAVFQNIRSLYPRA